MATSTQINAITALYVGYFDRAPDPAGLQFWIDQIDNGREFNTIAADFAASAEAVALYPYLTTPDVSSPTAFITNIYANLFGRAPDAAGLEFWTGVLEDGSVSVADMIEEIILGARDDATAGTFDKTVLDNKVEVGLDWAISTGNIPGFEFDAGAKAAAVAAVNGVTEDEATVEAAKAATDAFVAGDSNPGVGDNLSLTAAIGEQVVGTAGNDTFTAVVDGGTDGTLQFGDQVDGGAGLDTLNLFTGGATGIPAGVQISNIEVININASAAGSPVNAAEFGAAAQQIWQVGASEDITGLAAGQVAGFRNTDTGSVGYVAAAVAASIALDNVADASTLNVDGINLTSLTIAGTMDDDGAGGAGTLTVETTEEDTATTANDGSNIETLTVNSMSDIILDLTDLFSTDDFVTFDGSGSTGGIELDVQYNSMVSTILTGSGDDTVLTGSYNAKDGVAEVSADVGAGNDTLELDLDLNPTGNNVAFTATLGEGNDIAEISYLYNIADASEDEFENGIAIITDFNASEDVINLSGMDVHDATVGRQTLINTEQSAISNADTLYDALVLAASYIDNDTNAATDDADFAVFTYGGNAYILHDSNDDGMFSDNDGVIELAGVSAAELNAANFVV